MPAALTDEQVLEGLRFAEKVAGEALKALFILGRADDPEPGAAQQTVRQAVARRVAVVLAFMPAVARTIAGATGLSQEQITQRICRKVAELFDLDPGSFLAELEIDGQFANMNRTVN